MIRVYVSSSELAPATPFPARECVSPHLDPGGGDTHACGGGGGEPIQTTGRKLYTVYSVHGEKGRKNSSNIFFQQPFLLCERRISMFAYYH
jgi:hypothetical protein